MILVLLLVCLRRVTLVALVTRRLRARSIGRHLTTAWGKASVELSGLGVYRRVINVGMKYCSC